jgi:anti-sigma B factor antagonist
MDIEKRIDGGVVLLEVSGELTAVTAEQLSAVVEQAITETNKMVLDFKDLEYLASAGLRVILNAKKKLNGLKGDLIIRNASENVMTVFEMTGLNDVFAFE